VIDPRLGYGTTIGILASLLALEFVVLGIAPVSRSAWLLENMLVFGLVAILALTYRTFRFSRISYTLIFVFLAIHEVGSHYTYSLVPYDEFFERSFGFSLNQALGLERNHFDRFVHFAYGLLLTYPMREVFLRLVDVRGFWGYFLPLDLTMSTSMVYELIEWGAATLFGGDLGQEYLGTQGDEWDAHKDMVLAVLGACIAMGITLSVNMMFQRDFNAQWADSFRVKHPKPLGEEALAEMLEDRPEQEEPR
jgi:putative membrane protein